MTSEVMARVPRRRYPGVMSHTTSAPSPWIARVVLAVFGVWTVWIAARHGYTGFIELALAEAWAAQMLVDLVIALVLVIGWMVADARRSGRSPWGYVALTLVAGSIGPLLYLSLRRGPAAEGGA
jgi:uncharacterized membrane protein YtjA (UPF0391 family)